MKPDLSQLRDIHTPAAVSWWPPAPGWWLLALLVVATGIGVGAWLWLYQRNRWRRAALGELRRVRSLDAAAQVRELSVLLRRVALRRYPREQVAALAGDAWLAFLDRAMGQETPFQSGVGRVLAVGPYAPAPAVETEALLALCERWIKRLPGGGR